MTQASAAATTTDTADTYDMAMTVATLDDLFNAPAVNPFVDSDLRAIGEPALHRVVRELQVHKLGDKRRVRLTLRVPASQLTPERGSAQVTQAIHRYCDAKINDNELAIRIAREHARRQLIIASITSAVVLAVAYLLYISVLSQAGQPIQVVVFGSASVYVWVVMWDTLEELIFDPIPYAQENRSLRRLRAAEIVVQPIATSAAAPDGQGRDSSAISA
ncbi:MAG: hypothetical protein OJF49_001040 [Ktedonobacterales bacterium]|jgi:hypothetical protein|nr:MAG: hypothetical protein OJF49_001040 [Ktedonobacterales bacterium]